MGVRDSAQHAVLTIAGCHYQISGGDVWVGQAPVAEPGRVLALEPQRLRVVALEQGDEQGQREEAVRTQFEQLDVVVRGQRFPGR